MNRPQSPVGRTHDRLGGALARFPAISGAIRGARVIDLTGSTPGFAAVLLERGAAHVANVAVGPSPLSPRLRADPRVSFVERVQWKTLAASAAPGPFAFFTVDVKFISARPALRMLAFRLAPGTHGIVWLKQQFEVPAEQIKRGGVTGTPLRSHALTQLRERAQAGGFEIVEAVDLSDPPDDDTEILVHLLFRGRADRA